MRRGLQEGVITIGRDPSADIHLVETDISRIHFSISWNNGSYTLTDMSTNGTFVNDKPVQTHTLKPSDVIRIGDWRISFDESGDNDQQKTVVRDVSPTKVLKFESQKKEILTESIRLKIISPQSKAREFKLAGAVIGSSPGCDIVIEKDDYISTNHCKIFSVDEKYFLEDLSSKNGTFHDGEKIDKIELSKKGEIGIGNTRIQYRIERASEKLKPAAMTSLGPIIGKSQGMRELFTLVSRVAPSDATACLIGESGTGKELIARYIHESSPRHAKPFVAINCGAIPENLIESELFGHEKGAFTNATSQHRGVFEQTDGGTLFLDEIGEMPPDLQTRLLRVLETKMIKRVGGQVEAPVDVRVITATNKDLKVLVKEGLFREDLFFRLYVIPINILPLRERKEDIPLLVEHLLEELLPEGVLKTVNSAAMNKMLAYDWPGNVRELKNTIQRAILISDKKEIAGDDITFSNLSLSGEDLPESMAGQKQDVICNALKSSNGNISEAARKLKISRTTLASMIKRFDIDVGELKIRP